MATRARPSQNPISSDEKRSILAMPDGSSYPVAADLPPAFDEDEIEETAVDRVYALLHGASGDDRASLKVYRKTADGKMAYCASYSPHEFEAGGMDMIRDTFGAGDFELRLYGVNPAGHFGVLRRIVETIVAPLQPIRTGGAESPMNQALMMLMQQNQAILEKLATPPAAAPAVDPMAQMSAMFGMMAQMREAMGLNAPQSREKSSIGEIVSAIRELRGAAEELTPEKSEPDSLLSMAPQFMELISKGIEAQRGANVAPQGGPLLDHDFPPVSIPPSVAQAQAQMQPQPQPQNPQGEDVNFLQIMALKAQFSQLLKMAAENKPAAEGGEFIASKLPDELLDILETDQWFEVLLKFAPEAQPHQAWLTAARDNAISRLYAGGDDNGGT